MANNWQIIKKIIIVLIFINVVSTLILLKKTDVIVDAFSPKPAIAADDAKSDTNKNKIAEEGDTKSEETKKDDATKQAEDAKLVLEGLEVRRLQLKEKEENIVREQKKLQILKKELEEKITELEKIHSQINTTLEKLDQKKSEQTLKKEADEDRKIKQLVKVYSSMKPKNAGQIINNMDIIVAEKIIKNMKGDDAGKILSYVESSRAAAISERIAATVRKK